MMPKPVVVGTDGSGESLHAVKWAAAEAARRSAPLRIVSVMAVPAHVSSAGDYPATLDDLMASVYHQSLRTAAEHAALVAPGLTIGTELLTGSPRKLLIDAADAASMLVVGAYGIGGYAQPGAGPETRHVTLHARCPIAVIRDPGGIEHREIAVGIRSWDDAEATLWFAFEEAALRKARLTVVHACGEHNPPAENLTERLSIWRRLFPQVAVSYRGIDGHPARILTSYSGFEDLIVVGRHDGPNHSISHGSVMQALLDHAEAPVIIVPSG